MVVQNFFSDVLLSLLHLFEDYIFDKKGYFFSNVVQDSKPHSFFKSVQFNIGNRNLQIGDYKEAGQLEFPTGLFTFVSDETAWGKAANLIGHHRIMHVNEILCTHNLDTGIDIICREEQSMIYMTAQINCASMLQANEVVHQIKRFLPPQRFVQIFDFDSFIPIPPIFFDGKYNNPSEHEIENLFLKYDGTTGEKNYFYRAHYKPLVQLNSASADLADNSARSFSVSCDFSYLIQLPLWLFDTYQEDRIQRVNLSLHTGDSISSIVVDNNFLSVCNTPIKLNGTYYNSREQYIIDQSSRNFHSDRIVIPLPVYFENKITNSAAEKKDDFIISIAKLHPRESTVVHFLTPKTYPKFGLTTDNTTVDPGDSFFKTEYLNDGDFLISDQNITIFTHDNINLRPDLYSPVIITILQPSQDRKKIETTDQKNNKNNHHYNMYQIKKPKYRYKSKFIYQ